MTINAALLRASLSLVAEREPEFVARFYQLLFTRYPQVRPLFSRHAPEKQENMLREAIVAAVTHLEDPGWLTRELGVMGARHREYGVQPHMYAWVGECLLATLAEAAGADWSDDLQANWAAAYCALRDLMLAGAEGGEPA